MFNAGVPVLGVCYGMQTMAMQLGGHVQGSNEREFGYAQVEIVKESALLRDIEDAISPAGKPLLDVWMSHGDKVTAIPSDFVTIASTDTCPFAIKRRKTLLRRAVPPGSDPHPSGPAHAGAFRTGHLPV